MASFVYISFPADAMNGNAVTSNSYRAILCASAHTPSDLHTRRNQLTNELPTANGYTQGGTPITVTVATNTATKKTTLTIGQVSWPNSTLAARTMHVVRWRGGAASADELVCCVDNGASDLVSSNTPMTWFASTWEIPLPPAV